MAGPADSAIQPFHVAKVIDGILDRVRRAYWPDQLHGNPWQYGTELELYEGAGGLLDLALRLA